MRYCKSKTVFLCQGETQQQKRYTEGDGSKGSYKLSSINSSTNDTTESTEGNRRLNNNSYLNKSIPEGILKCARRTPTHRTIKAFQRIAKRRGISPQSAIALLGGGEND